MARSEQKMMGLGEEEEKRRSSPTAGVLIRPPCKNGWQIAPSVREKSAGGVCVYIQRGKSRSSTVFSSPNNDPEERPNR